MNLLVILVKLAFFLLLYLGTQDANSNFLKLEGQKALFFVDGVLVEKAVSS